ncbi:MAG: hypothetical protein LQ347_000747 [Umbilicaria vellea]|nr:MAG: hypothetical protein LQ347_000747 [Umbilicaria vellea]
MPEELWAAITSFPTEAENIVTQLIAGHVPTQLESLGHEIKSDAGAFASNTKSYLKGHFGKLSATAPPLTPDCLTEILTTSNTVVVSSTAAPSSSAPDIAAVTSSLSFTLPSLTSPTILDLTTLTTSIQYTQTSLSSVSTTQDQGSQQSWVSNETNKDAVGAGMLPLRVQGFWLIVIHLMMGLVILL